MKGKFSKNLGPLGPRATGALVGLVVVSAAATGVHASGLTSGDSGESVAAVEVLPSKKPSERTSRDDPGKNSGKNSSERSGKNSGERSGERSEKASKKRTEKRSGADSGDGSARSAVIARARTWNPGTGDRVPYSQTRTHEGYRTDCSGYVAMALGLDGPGPNTQGLTSSRYTKRISMSELKKGDLVMDAQGTNTTRHVVIFEKWANSAHTAYWAFEQRGRYGTDHRTRDYGLSSGSEYKAYRPTNL